MEQDALLKQVEYYFSPSNLTNDTYLVSQMNSEYFVPLDTILKFKMVQKHTSDIQVLKKVVKTSRKLVLNRDESLVKPVDIVSEEIQKERNTLILRDAKSKQQDIEKLFDEKHFPTSIKKEVGENWFITFKNETETLNAFEYLKTKTLNDEVIKVRVKSEPLIRQFLIKESSEKVNRPLSFAEIALSAKELKVPTSTSTKQSTTSVTTKSNGDKTREKKEKKTPIENGGKQKGNSNGKDKKKPEPKRLHK